MPSKRIEAALRRLLEPRSPAPARKDAAEERLLAAYDRRHAESPRAFARGFGLLDFARVHRWAVASTLLAALSVGACYAPTEVEVPMGVTVEFISRDEDPHALVEQMLEYVRESTGATEVNVEAWKRDDGPLQIKLRVWGPGVPADLDEELGEAFSQLREAELTASPLEGKVRTTLGRRLGHHWFDIGWAEDDLDGARVRLLEELAAQGIAGEVEIEITESDGRKQVRVQVQQELDEGGVAPGEGERHIRMHIRRDGVEEVDVVTEAGG